jgi:hypothetical protein
LVSNRARPRFAISRLDYQAVFTEEAGNEVPLGIEDTMPLLVLRFLVLK